MEESKTILNLQDVAEYTDLKPKTIYSLVHFRKIPFYKRGKRLYFLKDEITAWLLMDKYDTQDEIDQQETTLAMKRRLR